MSANAGCRGCLSLTLPVFAPGIAKRGPASVKEELQRFHRGATGRGTRSAAGLGEGQRGPGAAPGCSPAPRPSPRRAELRAPWGGQAAPEPGGEGRGSLFGERPAPGREGGRGRRGRSAAPAGRAAGEWSHSAELLADSLRPLAPSLPPFLPSFFPSFPLPALWRLAKPARSTKGADTSQGRARRRQPEPPRSAQVPRPCPRIRVSSPATPLLPFPPLLLSSSSPRSSLSLSPRPSRSAAAGAAPRRRCRAGRCSAGPGREWLGISRQGNGVWGWQPVYACVRRGGGRHGGRGVPEEGLWGEEGIRRDAGKGGGWWKEGVRGRGAGADSCFPRTRSPLPRCRRGVGLPGGPRSPVPLPTPPPLPGAGGRCWAGRAGGGRAPPPDGASRTLPRSRRVGSGTPGTMPRLGGGWPAAPRLSPASAAVLLGVLCLPGAPASSLLTGTAGAGGAGPPAPGGIAREGRPEVCPPGLGQVSAATVPLSPPQKVFLLLFFPRPILPVSPRGFYLPEIWGMERNAESNSSAREEPLDFEEWFQHDRIPTNQH